MCVFFKLSAQQTRFISRDTLLNIFKNNTIYKSLDMIGSLINYDQNLDYKNLYYDKELKNYFIKSLNRNSISEYQIEKDVIGYIQQLNEKEYLKSDIRSFLYERKRGKQIDSILKSEKLILKFKDSVIKDRISLYKKNRNFKNSIPELRILTKIKYHEVYDSIKKWSIELPNKNFMQELLGFNDPTTQKMFDKKIENYIKTNGEKESFKYYQNIIYDTNTAYVSSKIYNLLSIDNPEVVLYDNITNSKGETTSTNGIYTSSNFEFSRNIFYIIKVYKLPYENLLKEFKEISERGNEETKNKFIKKNKGLLKKILIEGCNLMKKDEEYWMKNMPFYKKK